MAPSVARAESGAEPSLRESRTRRIPGSLEEGGWPASKRPGPCAALAPVQPLSAEDTNLPSEVREIVTKASTSWLKNLEVCVLLQGCQKFGFPVSNEPPERPPGELPCFCLPRCLMTTRFDHGRTQSTLSNRQVLPFVHLAACT